MSKKVVIVAAARTPIGSFMGALSTVTAPRLGAAAIKGALDKINLDPKLVDEVIMGNVVQAGVGQAPARQAALYAGLSEEVACTTVNKVCASGMKAIMQGAQAIMAGDAEIVVAGGMENMSMIPHYVHMRNGVKFGPTSLLDGMQKDGLTDAYDNNAMGVCADLCATEYNITREEQDKLNEARVIKEDIEVPEGAIQIDMFMPTVGEDGETKLERKKFYTQAEAPLHLQEGSAYHDQYQPKRSDNVSIEEAYITKTIISKTGEKKEIKVLANQDATGKGKEEASE